MECKHNYFQKKTTSTRATGPSNAAKLISFQGPGNDFVLVLFFLTGCGLAASTLAPNPKKLMRALSISPPTISLKREDNTYQKFTKEG